MNKILKWTAKIFFWGIVTIGGLFVLGLLVSSIIYTPEYVYRLLAWGESDYYDYRDNFPSRTLEPAPTTYYFQEAHDEPRVSETFETVLEVDARIDLETDTIKMHRRDRRRAYLFQRRLLH